MGRSLLILLVGFAASFGMLANSKNRRHLDSVDRAVNQFSNYSANNAAASGAYMALNRLYQDNTWRTGYTNLVLAGDTVVVNIADNTTDSTLSENRIKITSIGHNDNLVDYNQVLLFDGQFNEYAIWAKDTVMDASTVDPSSNPDSSLMQFNAPFMPEIDQTALTTAATTQLHLQSGSPWTPVDNYPNGDFYYLGTTPNVTKVTGSLKVKSGRTVYGIYLVDGDITFEGTARVEGVLLQTNSSSQMRNVGTDPGGSSINGGVLTWGLINGSGKQIEVKYNSTFMNAFTNGYVPENPPLRVLTWQ